MLTISGLHAEKISVCEFQFSPKHPAHLTCLTRSFLACLRCALRKGLARASIIYGPRDYYSRKPDPR